jgi:hypothetical protein
LKDRGTLTDVAKAVGVSVAVDGLIIYTMPKHAATIQTVMDRGLPMIVVDQFLLPNVPFIGIEERAAARAKPAVFGDRKRPVDKDALQFERVLASGFVPGGIFGPSIWSDLNLLGDVR